MIFARLNVLRTLARQVSATAPAFSRRRSMALLALGLICSGGLQPGLPAATLIRGPCLQLATTSSVVVCWRTLEPADSRVRYGLQSGAPDLSVQDTALVTNHVLRITGLVPATRYFYTVGSSAEELAGGPDCSFTTAPAEARPARVWVIGDTRSTILSEDRDSRAEVREAWTAFSAERPADFLFNTGDLSDMGLDAELQAAYFDVYAPLLRHTVSYAVLGNHDLGTDRGQAYLDSFVLPADGEGGGVPSGSERYYSFNYADIHFVVLDDYGPDVMELGLLDPDYLAAQLDWLQRDLSSNSNTWLICMFHSPPYTKGSHDSDWEWDSVNTRIHFAPVLESFGADLVICGHSHNYERSYLLRGHYGDSTTFTESMKLNAGDGRPDGDGPYYKPDRRSGTVYVVVGSSGFLG